MIVSKVLINLKFLKTSSKNCRGKNIYLLHNDIIFKVIINNIDNNFLHIILTI